MRNYYINMRRKGEKERKKKERKKKERKHTLVCEFIFVEMLKADFENVT